METMHLPTYVYVPDLSQMLCPIAYRTKKNNFISVFYCYVHQFTYQNTQYSRSILLED